MSGPTNNDPKFEGAGKLIGGYSSGNLSPQEKDALFNAALRDQDVFDALMEEQALKELLEEPGVKADLIAALQPKVSLLDRVKNFLATPVAWGTMGAVATAAVLLTVILPSARNRSSSAPQTTAEVRPPQRSQDAASPAPLQSPPAEQSSSRPSTVPAPKKVAEPPAEPPVVAMKEQERREQAAAESQERDRRLQQQQTPPAVQNPAPLQEQLSQQPVPAAAAGMAGSLLAIDYALLRRSPDGSYQTATTVRATDSIRLQVMPSETGYLSLYRRTPDGLLNAVSVGQPVTRGQVVQIPAQGGITISESSFVLLLSRDSVARNEAKSAPGGSAQGFRQSPVELRAKRAADTAKSSDAAPPATTLLLDLATRKAVLPSLSLGRAAATSPADRTVAVEFTIRVEN